MSVIVLFDMVAATLLVLVVCLTGAVPFAPSLPAPSAVALLAVVLVVLVVVVGALAAPRLASRLRTLRHRIAQGGAILRTPRRYARQVVLVQAGAWTCRIAVVFFLLAAFRLPASVPTAGLVMVVAGLSTLVPLTPGGAGTQQAMLAYALRRTAGRRGRGVLLGGHAGGRHGGQRPAGRGGRDGGLPDPAAAGGGAVGPRPARRPRAK